MSGVAFIFSGKGSQYFQMGRELYDQNEVFRSHLERLDELAEGLMGVSTVQAVFERGEPRPVPIADPLLSVISIFMVECALARTLVMAGVKPRLLVGASMGIYAAAVLAGCMTEKEALRYLVRTARVFRQACEPGLMATVLASRSIVDSHPRIASLSEIAAVSFDEHCTLAFPQRNKIELEAELSRLGAAYQVLPISRAYHSAWIESARAPFLEIFSGHECRPAGMRLACCSGVTCLQTVRDADVWNAIRQPMYFKRLVDEIEKEGPWHYVDVGPSGTSATFLKYILPQCSKSRAYPILVPGGGDLGRLGQALSSLQL